MTTKPDSLFGDPDKSLIMRRGSTVWLNVEAENEDYAEELFKALTYIINEQVALEEVSRQGTTVALTMTLPPDTYPLEGEDEMECHYCTADLSDQGLLMKLRSGEKRLMCLTCALAGIIHNEAEVIRHWGITPLSEDEEEG